MVGYLAPGPMWTRESVAQLDASWLAEESKGHHRKFSWPDPSQSGSSSLEPTCEKSRFPLQRTLIFVGPTFFFYLYLLDDMHHTDLVKKFMQSTGKESHQHSQWNPNKLMLLQASENIVRL